ncbi:hypothetical protein J0S82_003338 [Galemys pyrenaicus]|uniref:Uncharacterized protein n=1 Tax=Galemys pyrenaicus TaxID=202257 RepID=A0A8J6DM21_GALPY|nr:hypothetical protein J0S82_003338 [Galemys pyrenaicus]
MRLAGAAAAGARPVSARAAAAAGGALGCSGSSALGSSMALPGPPEPPRGAPRKAPSLLEMGALCLDSEIILGFTSHLLRRRAKVRAGRRDPLAAEALSRRWAARLARLGVRRGKEAAGHERLGGPGGKMLPSVRGGLPERDGSPVKGAFKRKSAETRERRERLDFVRVSMCAGEAGRDAP